MILLLRVTSRVHSAIATRRDTIVHGLCIRFGVAASIRISRRRQLYECKRMAREGINGTMQRYVCQDSVCADKLFPLLTSWRAHSVLAIRSSLASKPVETHYVATDAWSRPNHHLRSDVCPRGAAEVRCRSPDDHSWQ